MRLSLMTRIGVILSFMLVASGSLFTSSQAGPIAKHRQIALLSGDNVVIRLTTYTLDPEDSYLAFHIGTLLATKGEKVIVWLTGEAVQLATALSEQPIVVAGKSTTLKVGVQGFLDAGGSIVLTDIFASKFGLSQSQLRPGFRIASQSELADLIASSGKVITW